MIELPQLVARKCGQESGEQNEQNNSFFKTLVWITKWRNQLIDRGRPLLFVLSSSWKHIAYYQSAAECYHFVISDKLGG